MIAPFNKGAGYRLTSPFGKRNLGNGVEMHNGIDLVSYGSKEVIAVESGTVVQTVTDSYNMDLVHPRGNLVKVKGNETGYTVYYQHLNSVSVSVGDKVKKGDILGIEGNTGRVWSANGGTGIHLHFEVRDKDNKAIQPSMVFDIPNNVGDYKPSDLFTRDTSDQNYVDNKNQIDSATDSKTESNIQYASELNGKYEPIYNDLTSSPILFTKDYEERIKNYNIDNIAKIVKKNNGTIPNSSEPYNADKNIYKLEKHSPKVVLDNVAVDRLKSNMPTNEESVLCAAKMLELVETIDKLSKATEKRLVKLENIMAPNIRYLHRLSSRINVNCVYYGGQSIYDKYLCIRCLDDNLVNDIPVSLDQCLNCTRYEPIEGQVYDLPESQYLDPTVLNSSVIIDDSQATRVDTISTLDNIKVDKYATQYSKLSQNIKQPDERIKKSDVINEAETPLSEQKPNIALYKIEGMPQPTNNSYDNLGDYELNPKSIFDIEDQYMPKGPMEKPKLNSAGIYIPSDKIIKVMADYESFQSTRYKDGLDPQTGKQMYSIGFGHQILSTDNIKEPITLEKAYELLKNDAISKAKVVTTAMRNLNVFTMITQCELDALVCFTCSCGGRKVVNQAAAKYIINKTKENMAEFYKAITNNGIYYSYYENGVKKSKKLEPLVQRRIREYNIFIKGDYDI